jgi:hypothetical protein
MWMAVKITLNRVYSRDGLHICTNVSGMPTLSILMEEEMCEDKKFKFVSATLIPTNQTTRCHISKDILIKRVFLQSWEEKKLPSYFHRLNSFWCALLTTSCWNSQICIVYCKYMALKHLYVADNKTLQAALLIFTKTESWSSQCPSTTLYYTLMFIYYNH